MFTREADLARAAFEAWENGKLREWATDGVHPDVDFHDAPELPDAQVMRGREASLARMDEFMEQLGRFSIPVCEVLERAHGVFVRVAPTSRAPSGVTLDWEVFCVMRFQEGRLIEIRNFFDRDTALEEADLDRSISHH